MKRQVISLEGAFIWVAEQSTSKITSTLLPDTDWQKGEVILSFVEGKVQPLKIMVFLEEGDKVFFVNIENMEYEEGKELLIKRYEETYALSQSEKIKPLFHGDWNTIQIEIERDLLYHDDMRYFTFR